MTEQTMQCMEVWGGNSSTSSHFSVPGLEIWIYSEPYGNNKFGGDVYYLSSCASGRTTRLFIGDVSGHGEDASETAQTLKKIMRRNVHFIDHTRLANSVNREFEETSTGGRFATAVIATFFLPTSRLTLCNAGHPPPLHYTAEGKRWEVFHSRDDGGGGKHLPFGISADHMYDSQKCRLNEGDLLLCYTDAIFEARDGSGQQIGSSGLLTLLNEIGNLANEEIIPEVLQRLHQLNPTNLLSDDVTLLLVKRTGTRVPLRDELLAPFRFVSDLLGIGAPD